MTPAGLGIIQHEPLALEVLELVRSLPDGHPWNVASYDPRLRALMAPLILRDQMPLPELFRTNIIDYIRDMDSEWTERANVLQATIPDLIAPARWALHCASITGQLREYYKTDSPTRWFVQEMDRCVEKMGDAVIVMMNDCKALAAGSSEAIATAVLKVERAVVSTCKILKNTASKLPRFQNIYDELASAQQRADELSQENRELWIRIAELEGWAPEALEEVLENLDLDNNA